MTHAPRAASLRIEPADPRSPSAQVCIHAYFQELQGLFDHGFDPTHSVSADPDELVPPAGWLLLAWLDAAAVGCGALKIQDGGTGEIKRMWVAPHVRGLGIAQRLLDALEARARAAAVATLRLDTHGSLRAARALYARNGFIEIAPYNHNPYAQHWFEKRLA